MQGGEKSGERGFVMLTSLVLVAAVLYFAKAVFIPIAVALLLTFLLAPLVLRLQKWKLPKPIAIVSTVTFALSIVACITWLVTTQLLALAEELPKYEQNLHGKIQRLKGSQSPGVFTRASEFIQSLQREFELPRDIATQPERGTPEQPLTVEVKARPNAWQTLRRTLGPLLGPAGTAGMVLILLLAMLFKREDMRDRFIKVISGGQLNKATEAFDDASRRISRYLLMQLVINVTYGIPIGVGLYFIGVPNALLWGVLAALLRFIPFLGPWIAALFPLALAFAIDPGWTKLALTIGLFITVELISNNLVEPWLYGSSTGVSPVAVIAGAIFWTWLWGGIGLFLCTPLTACLVVMGKHVPGLRFLHDMFGSEPVLQIHARFYQRMLAMDAEEMLRIADEFLEENDLVAFYDQVMIPALILAEEDRQTGRLAEIRQQFIVENTRELMDELGEREAIKRGHGRRQTGPAEILCVPAKDDADQLAALMLVQMLQFEGARAELAAMPLHSGECDERARRGTVRAVVVSALPPSALGAARRVCRLMKYSCPKLRVLAGVWTSAGNPTELMQRLASAHADGVVTTLKNAVQQLCGTPEESGDDRKSDEDYAGIDLDHSEPEELYNKVRREIARTFDVPLSFISIVPLDTQFWKVHDAEPREREEMSDLLRDSTVCAQMIDATEPVVVEDVSKEKRLADDPFLQARGIQSFVATPMRTEAGHVVGSVCVLDTKPRSFELEQLRTLAILVGGLFKTIETRPAHAV